MECKNLPPLASTTERTAPAYDFEPINASCNLGSIVDVLLKAAMAELAAKELLFTKWNIERQAALGLAGFFCA